MFPMVILVRLTQVSPGTLFNARRSNISANLGFNMWKGLRACRRLIASYFRPAGKTRKLTAQYIAGLKGRKGNGGEGDRRASERENKKQLTVLTLLIVATDGIRHCIGGERFFPVFPGKKKEKKIVEPIIAHPTDLLHIRSSLPNRLFFPLYITISATCSPGNNRFTGRIRAELALYTRRG